MNDYDNVNWVNGIFEDGEWESWDFEEHTHELNLKANPSTLELWGLFDELVMTAKTYLNVTGRHLPIYGELGELFGEAKYGIQRHKPNSPGSDGRMGNDFVEIKTISPQKTNNTVWVKRAGNFNKLLIVKITDEFKFESIMVDRKDLNKGSGKFVKSTWKDSNN